MKKKLTKINVATAALGELIVSCVPFGFDALLCACDQVSDLREKRPLAGEPRFFLHVGNVFTEVNILQINKMHMFLPTLKYTDILTEFSNRRTKIL